MKDPFPIAPPEALVSLVKPLADSLSLPTLALHAHEVLFAFFLYTFVDVVVSPIISKALFPQTYNKLNRRSRINWDVHVVSFFQAVLISVLSLWVIFCDEERKETRPRERWESRIYEYSGAGGMLQSFALGYFMWDFIMCSWHIEIFGLGMLAHAISAFSVFALGYVSHIVKVKLSSDTKHLPEAVHLLLRASLSPLRAQLSLLEYPLVLRQARIDRLHLPGRQRRVSYGYLLRLSYHLGQHQ